MNNEVRVNIDIVSGVEGLSIYIDDTRICGNKPWGGGKVIRTFKNVDLSEVTKIQDLIARKQKEALAEGRLQAKGEK